MPAPEVPVFRAVQDYVRQLYGAGRRALRIRIELDDGEKLLLPVPPCPPPEPARPAARPSACEDDILDVLRREGRRLTTTELLAALERHGRIWGESTVKQKLAELVDDGRLDNDPRARPRGYGLPGG